MDEQVRARIPRVREMSAAETVWSATVHVDALPHGLFPRLGARFMQRWHLGHLRSPYGLALVAELDGAPVGMLIGTTDQLAHVRWVLAEDRRAMTVRGVRALLARPRVLGYFLRTRAMRYGRRLLRRNERPRRGTRRGGGSTPAGTRQGVAVVAALVVLPSAQRSGAGRALIDAFLDAAARAGAPQAELVTKADAAGASNFYRALGWEALGEHLDRDGDLVRLFATPTRRTTPPSRDRS